MVGYVPFCVCPALYQRVLHFQWLIPIFLRNIFAVFILTSPIFFIFKHSRGHKNLWWVLCQRRHSPQVVKTYLHDAPGWQTQYVGVIAGGHNWSVLILHGIRLTQEPACRRLINSCTWFDFTFQFSSFNSQPFDICMSTDKLGLF